MTIFSVLKNMFLIFLTLFFFQKYKPFKGVKYLTKAGNFQVRT